MNQILIKGEVVQIPSVKTPGIAYVTTDGTANGVVGDPSKPFTAQAAVNLGSSVIVDWGVKDTPWTVTIPDGATCYWRGAGLRKTSIVATCAGGDGGANGSDTVYHENPDNPGTYIIDQARTDGAPGANALPVFIHAVIPQSFSLTVTGPNGGAGGIEGTDTTPDYSDRLAGPGANGNGANLYLFDCGEVQATGGIGGANTEGGNSAGLPGDLYYQGCSLLTVSVAGGASLYDVDIFGTPNIVTAPGIGTASSNRIVFISS